MASQDYSYQTVRKKLMPQLKRCRDRDIRIKAELILYVKKIENVALGCQRIGFGRSFFYKWWRRLVAGNFQLKSLQEKSRRPKNSPNKVSGYIESRISFYRRKGYGADMVREYLRRENLKSIARSTINHVLNKRKPSIKKRSFKLKKHRLRYELVIPGQRLQLDVKYSPMLVGGKTVYIYVAVDECTRWRFAKAYAEVNEHWTLDFLEQLEKACPFPIWCIQTDNGHEFTFNLLPGNTREHAMDTWCRENKIKHQLIPPGVKELNGKVERSHRIDADYFYGRAPTKNLEIFNKALSQWVSFYNTQRPHGGLGYKTPKEKLKERVIALQTHAQEEAIEPIRQRFLKEGPRLIMNQNEKQILADKLGVSLQTINKAS
jgi:transposase InsO family protein